MTKPNAFAVTFPNIPDAGARHFDCYTDAATFASSCGFHAQIVHDGCVIARNSSTGGDVRYIPSSECPRCTEIESAWMDAEGVR